MVQLMAVNDTELLHVDAPKPVRRKRRAHNGSLPGSDETVSRAQLERLQAFAAELASPLPLVRIAAVVGEAAMELLDAEIVVVAVHVDDSRHLRGVHIAGIPENGHDRLSAAPCDETSLVTEIDRLFGSNGASRSPAALAVLPIQQVVCPRGLMVVGRAEARPFSEVERAFASVLAGLCGLALDRLRLSAERTRARRRRHAPETAGTHVRVGDMDIDLVGHNVSIEGRAATLTTSEMRLLTFLAEQPGRARSRREILRHLWHTEHVGDERACDVHISNLRRKIERQPSRPERLVTLRGYGYALMPR
jgi:DNA-binding winged helix-turn-helix (wHTH) protein